jgi:IS5 family transposase
MMLHPTQELEPPANPGRFTRVEHPFPVIKRQSGYPVTRYRKLVKYRAQLFMLFALGNLCLVRRKLMA